MQENKPGKKIWLCNGCLDFPFTNIDNKKILLLYENENSITNNINLTKFGNTCSICLCKQGKPLKVYHETVATLNSSTKDLFILTFI